MHHFQVFVDHKHKIDEHNLHYENGIVPFKMGLNKYSDLTHEEFVERMSRHKPNIHEIDTDDKSSIFVAFDDFQLPTSVDWREKGAVTVVKDQGFCGSSWAFSAIGSVESQYALKTGRLLSLSEQNLIDCSGIYGTDGCTGGLPEQAFKYIHDHGIFTEEAYSYDGHDHDYCKLTVRGVKKPNVTVHGFTRISSGNEEDLQKALAIHGPISVSIDAKHHSFNNYAEGIWHEPNCSKHDADLNHAVLLVGFGTDEYDRDYYILKNSWSSSWGENGYFRMSRNQMNYCGVASMAVFPNI
ncbi:procathepsin L-like [Sitodiplosis mosellana]|uniref:procathepsin L-like n=1 Tax=Sitodiplosis mosellana TaxID=263140 RepID=UPI00244459EA|nr:procathepsin L-like [Sitodiplosis mosellana]XP_055297311.1 procathepsin L-like [Sitodiplosis mosellana]XP_055297312.1 procathepsin L-like [Sitodiplosis mosellana]